jgi:hypothetical protein
MGPRSLGYPPSQWHVVSCTGNTLEYEPTGSPGSHLPQPASLLSTNLNPCGALLLLVNPGSLDPRPLPTHQCMKKVKMQHWPSPLTTASNQPWRIHRKVPLFFPFHCGALISHPPTHPPTRIYSPDMVPACPVHARIERDKDPSAAVASSPTILNFNCVLDNGFQDPPLIRTTARRCFGSLALSDLAC